MRRRLTTWSLCATQRATALLALAATLASAPGVAQECDQALGRFDYGQAQSIAEQLLAAAPDDTAAWVCLARSRYERGDFQAALEALRRTEALAAGAALRTLAWNWFGVTLRRLGQTDAAWRYQVAALRLAEGSADPAGLGTARHNLAGLLHDAGRLDDALTWYRASLAVNPDAAERSASLNNMALIEASRGNDRLATDLFSQAVAVNRSSGHFHHLGKHLMNLGDHQRRRGRLSEAESLIAEGAALVAQAGDRYWVGVARHLEAWLARDRGQTERARASLRAAAAAYREAGAVPDAERADVEAASLGPTPPTR